MTLVLDNYDSFTYNLVQILGVLGAGPKVVRNDAMSVDALVATRPGRVIVSPGPGTPARAGVSVALARAFAGRAPLLGVCLGHQAVAEAHGGRIRRAARLVHGRTSPVRHDGDPLYEGIEDRFAATRYHSLVVDEDSLPDALRVTARSEDDGEIMGLRHRDLPVWGVQFHPESILTESGKRLLANFLKAAPA